MDSKPSYKQEQDDKALGCAYAYADSDFSIQERGQETLSLSAYQPPVEPAQPDIPIAAPQPAQPDVPIAAPQPAQTPPKRKRKGPRLVVAIALVCLVCLCFPILSNGSAEDYFLYRRAVRMMDQGDYESAYSLFAQLGDYRDAVSLCEESKLHLASAESIVPDSMAPAEATEPAEMPSRAYPLANRSPGYTFCLGSYEQDNNFQNGQEPIEWIVLTTEGNRALVISKQILDCVAYSLYTGNTTWETSTLRTWLNETFLDIAFTAEDQQFICSTRISNPDNPETGCDGGPDTTDRFFLLSIEEAIAYQHLTRNVNFSEYARNKSMDAADYMGELMWWLRSPGIEPYLVAEIGIDDAVLTHGENATLMCRGVRPMMWIYIE